MKQHTLHHLWPFSRRYSLPFWYCCNSNWPAGWYPEVQTPQTGRWRRGTARCRCCSTEFPPRRTTAPCQCSRRTAWWAWSSRCRGWWAGACRGRRRWSWGRREAPLWPSTWCRRRWGRWRSGGRTQGSRWWFYGKCGNLEKTQWKFRLLFGPSVETWNYKILYLNWIEIRHYFFYTFHQKDSK